MATADLTAARLREVLHYDPDSGIFTRLGANAEKVAGTLSSEGYTTIGIDSRRYRAARLAWLYMTGEWPPDQVDHINGRKSDDRFVNLRKATALINAANRGNPAGNFASQFKGIDRHGNGWRAVIEVRGRRIRGPSRRLETEARDDYLRLKIENQPV